MSKFPLSENKDDVIDISDDEAILTLIQHVLVPNDFTILYVNEPGSHQYDNSSLSPSIKDLTFPDVIASPPKGVTDFDVLVIGNPPLSWTQENLTDANYAESLRKSLTRIPIEIKDIKPEKILFGTVLCGASSTKRDWLVANTDLLFFLPDREHWSLGIFSDSLLELFPKLKGETNFLS